MTVISTTRGAPQISEVAVQAALPMVGSVSRTDGQTVLSNVDAELEKLFEDRNVLLQGGGLLTLSGLNLSFSANLIISVNSKLAGGTPLLINLGSSAQTFTSVGDMLVAVIDRTGLGSGTMSVVSVSLGLPAVTSANQEVFMLAKVVTVNSTSALVFRNGTTLFSGQTAYFGADTTLVSGDDPTKRLKFDGTNQITATAATIATTSTVDRTYTLPDVTDTFALVGASQTLSSKTLQTIRGVVVTDSATTGSNQTLPSGDINCGVVRLTNASLASLAGITAGVSGQVLILENQTGSTLLVNDNSSSASAGNKIRTGTSAPVTMLANSTLILTYDAVTSFWMVSSGSGSGSGTGNPTLETIKNEFVDSPYQLVTPNIVATDAATKFSAFSGTAPASNYGYDIANNVIKFSTIGDQAISNNMLDPVEFLGKGLDVGSVDLSVFWSRNTISQNFSIPTTFVYEVSRGADYFPVTMTQVGSTEVFRGNLRFDTSTTTESSLTDFVSKAVGGSQFTLTSTAGGAPRLSLGQPFSLAASSVIKSVVLSLKTGSSTPAGYYYVSIVKDSGGVPSTDPADVLSMSNGNLCSSLTPSFTQPVIPIPSVILQPGTTYHLVLSTDATYKTAYLADNNKSVFVENNTSTPSSPYINRLDVGGWAPYSPNSNLYHKITGRVLDLRVRITAAGSPTYPCGLAGYGIFYNLQDVGIVGATKKVQRFVFTSVTQDPNNGNATTGLSQFAITGFSPDPDLLEIYHVETGQVYKSPAFGLQGSTAVFPIGTFANGGQSTIVTLIASQNQGGAFDSSDSNRRLLTTNHLGSPSGTDDASQSGRGVYLRTAAGTLREMALNATNQLQVLDLAQTPVTTLVDTVNAQTAGGAKTWNDVQTWYAVGGTVSAGSYSSAGAWSLGSSVGATKTTLRTNANDDTLLIRNHNVTAGQSYGIAVVAGTNSSDYAQQWLAADGATIIGKAAGSGGWTLGNSSLTSTTLQTLRGSLRVVQSGNVEVYVGASGGGYPVITYNAAPTGTINSFTRPNAAGTDRASILYLGNSVDGGNAFEFHAFSSGTSSPITTNSSSFIGGVSTTGSWVFGPTSGSITHIFNIPTVSNYVQFAGAGYTAKHSLDGTGYKIATDSGSRVIQVIANTLGVQLAAGGTAWTSLSDIRFKRNILNLNYGLAEVVQINPIRFNFTEDFPERHSRIGFSAQNLQTIISEAVVDSEDKLQVAPTELIPVLVNAVKDLKLLLDAQAAEIAALKAKV